MEGPLMDSMSALGERVGAADFQLSGNLSIPLHDSSGHERTDRRSVIRLRANMPWRSNEHLARVTNGR